MHKFTVYSDTDRVRRFRSLATLARAMGRGYFSGAGKGFKVTATLDVGDGPLEIRHMDNRWRCTFRPSGVPRPDDTELWTCTYWRPNKRADWFPNEVTIQVEVVRACLRAKLLAKGLK